MNKLLLILLVLPIFTFAQEKKNVENFCFSQEEIKAKIHKAVENKGEVYFDSSRIVDVGITRSVIGKHAYGDIVFEVRFELFANGFTYYLKNATHIGNGQWAEGGLLQAKLPNTPSINASQWKDLKSAAEKIIDAEISELIKKIVTSQRYAPTD